MPKIALIETKRITVYGSASSAGKLEAVRNEPILEPIGTYIYKYCTV
jgi:hypothetical protein